MIKSLLWVHVACGIAAILLGAVAVAVRKGGRLHVRAGNWFAGAMIGLGLTAAILEPFRWFVRAFTAQRVWPDFVRWAGLGLAADVGLLMVVFALDAHYLESAAAACEVEGRA